MDTTVQIILILVLLTLLVPLAAVIGWRWRRGAMVACAVGALLALPTVAILSLTAPTYEPMTEATQQFFTYAEIYLLVGGLILLTAGWAIALENALATRRWLSFALVTLGIYLAPILYFYANALPVYSGACQFTTPPTTASACDQIKLFGYIVLIAALSIGSISILLYAFLGNRTRPSRAPSAPDGETPLTPTVTPSPVEGNAQ